MSDKWTTALEVAGMGLVVAAAVLVNVVLGIAVAGVGLILIGWLLGRRG